MTSFASVIHGTAFTSPSPSTVEVLADHLFCVDTEGVLAAVLGPDDAGYDATLAEYRDTPAFQELAEGQYLLPGFVDLHVHAPQWAQLGNALDRPLNEWLQVYTFPLESRYADLDFARRSYRHLVESLLSRGTTTVLYFATIHRPASVLLAEICAELGQRGLVGKVVMDDREQNPDYYRDADTATALAETEAFIKDVIALRDRTGAAVYPVVTPRFLPSCTDEALRGLGQLAARYDTHVQSHCSEGVWEHGFVQDRFGKSDTAAHHDFGLLTDKAVMAHCVYLDDGDLAMFHRTGTAVAHCPMSNAYFGGAVAPIGHYHRHEVEIGLGSDISGGWAPSMYETIRQTVVSSRMLADGVDPAQPDRGRPDSRLSLVEAFHFATAGGGRSLSLPVGQLAEGFAWDAQMVDINVPAARLPVFGDDAEHVLEKILYLATPENVRTVWVQGKPVWRRQDAPSAPG